MWTCPGPVLDMSATLSWNLPVGAGDVARPDVRPLHVREAAGRAARLRASDVPRLLRRRHRQLRVAPPHGRLHAAARVRRSRRRRRRALAGQRAVQAAALPARCDARRLAGRLRLFARVPRLDDALRAGVAAGVLGPGGGAPAGLRLHTSPYLPISPHISRWRCPSWSPTSGRSCGSSRSTPPTAPPRSSSACAKKGATRAATAHTMTSRDGWRSGSAKKGLANEHKRSVGKRVRTQTLRTRGG